LTFFSSETFLRGQLGLLLAIGVIAALLLSSCHSNADPTLNPVLSCSAATNVTLIYPVPNSTGVPDYFGSIELGSTVHLSKPFQAFVGFQSPVATYAYYGVFAATTPPTATPTPTATSTPTPSPAASTSSAPTPSPSPSPSATPLPSPTPNYYYLSASTGITWPANTLINVYLGDPRSECTPTMFLGSFTTFGVPAPNPSKSSS